MKTVGDYQVMSVKCPTCLNRHSAWVAHVQARKPVQCPSCATRFQADAEEADMFISRLEPLREPFRWPEQVGTAKSSDGSTGFWHRLLARLVRPRV